MKKYVPGILSLILMMFMVHKAYSDDRLVFSHMFTDGSLPGLVAQRFSESVNATNIGDREIAIVADGFLGDERQNIRQLVEGEIDFAITGDLFIAIMMPQFREISIPFVNTTFEQAAAMHRGSMADGIDQALQNIGILVLARYCIGQRFLTATKPVPSMDSLHGLRLRLPPDPVWTAVWRHLGAQTMNIPFPSLKEALARGDVDAQENPTTFIRSQGIYREHDYLMMTGHYVQYQFLLASERAIASLDPAQRQHIYSAAEEAADWACRTAMRQQEEDLVWLSTEGGMEIIEFKNSISPKYFFDIIEK